MLLSSFSFALMAATVKFAGDIPTVEKVFFRNLVSLAIAFVSVKSLHIPLIGNRRNRKWLVLRSTFGLLGVALYFYSIENINLADSSMLNRISPFFVTIFAALFINEKIRKIQIPALIFVFVGALMIIKPQFDMSVLPALAGLGGAACAGAAYTVIRYLSGKEHPAVIVFFFSFFSVVMLIPFLIVSFEMPTPLQFLYLILTGVFAAGGQFTLTYAYKYGKASEVSIYSYFHVVFAGILGFTFWGEVSDMWSILGAVLIVIVSVVLFLSKKKQTPSVNK